MRNRSWSKALLAASLATCAASVLAQAMGGTAPAPTAVVPATAGSTQGADALADALACRIGSERLPGLMEELREERAHAFAQTYRQYSAPIMDLYQLDEPVQAWGNASDAIVIAEQRVMMAVPGSLDDVTSQLEHALENSSASPLSGALDDQHALVIFKAEQPGLEGMILLGCEYRIPGFSLLDDPRDAWRKPAAQP
jgi:hypothetical protein